MTDHVQYKPRGGQPYALCGAEPAEGDDLIPMSEVRDPAGRPFDCVDCHRVLSGGHKHVPAPAAQPDDTGFGRFL